MNMWLFFSTTFIILSLHKATQFSRANDPTVATEQFINSPDEKRVYVAIVETNTKHDTPFEKLFVRKINTDMKNWLAAC